MALKEMMVKFTPFGNKCSGPVHLIESRAHVEALELVLGLEIRQLFLAL